MKKRHFFTSIFVLTLAICAPFTISTTAYSVGQVDTSKSAVHLVRQPLPPKISVVPAKEHEPAIEKLAGIDPIITGPRG